MLDELVEHVELRLFRLLLLRLRSIVGLVVLRLFFQEVVLHSVVKFCVVVNLVLFGDLANPWRKLNHSSVQELVPHKLKELVARLNMALC